MPLSCTDLSEKSRSDPLAEIQVKGSRCHYCEINFMFVVIQDRCETSIELASSAHDGLERVSTALSGVIARITSISVLHKFLKTLFGLAIAPSLP